MRLTLIEPLHVDDIVYPITPEQTPFSFVTGPRDTLWAMDEDGYTWTREADSDRWRFAGPTAWQEIA